MPFDFRESQYLTQRRKARKGKTDAIACGSASRRVDLRFVRLGNLDLPVESEPWWPREILSGRRGRKRSQQLTNATHSLPLRASVAIRKPAVQPSASMKTRIQPAARLCRIETRCELAGHAQDTPT